MASRTPRRFSAQAQYSGRVLASGAVPTAYETLQEGLRGLPPFGLSRVLTEWTLDPFLLVGTVWVDGPLPLGCLDPARARGPVARRPDRGVPRRGRLLRGRHAVRARGVRHGAAERAHGAAHGAGDGGAGLPRPRCPGDAGPAHAAAHSARMAARGAALAGGEGAHLPAADVRPVRRVAVGALLLRVVRGVAALAVRARADARAPGARRLAVLLAAARASTRCRGASPTRSGC